MFDKIKALFTLESRTSQCVFNLEEARALEVKAANARISTLTQQLDQLESRCNTRLSRIEVLFETELTAKALARDSLVRERRLDV
jgi:hypothetical protein